MNSPFPASGYNLIDAMTLFDVTKTCIAEFNGQSLNTPESSHKLKSA